MKHWNNPKRATPLIKFDGGKRQVFVKFDGKEIPVADFFEAVAKCKELNGK